MQFAACVLFHPPLDAAEELLRRPRAQHGLRGFKVQTQLRGGALRLLVLVRKARKPLAQCVHHGKRARFVGDHDRESLLELQAVRIVLWHAVGLDVDKHGLAGHAVLRRETQPAYGNEVAVAHHRLV